MRHVRRFIAIITGVAAWCLAATTTAYATMDPGRGVDGGGVDLSQPADSGTPLWQYLAYGALGVLLVVAIVGLGYSLSHSRRSEPSTTLRA